MNGHLKSIATVLVIIGMAFTVFFYMDTTYVDAAEFKEYQVMNDARWYRAERRDLIERKWKICERYKDEQGQWKPDIDPTIMILYTNTLIRIEEIDKRLEDLERY